MHISAIHIYPVKGLRGRRADLAAVEPWGLAGDRRWMVVDSAGRFVTQRQHPELATIVAENDPDGLQLHHAQAGAVRVRYPGHEAPRTAVTVWRDRVAALDAGALPASFLSDIIGEACRLVFMDDPERARPVDPTYAADSDRVSFADGFPLLVTTEGSLEDLNRHLVAPVPMDRFRPNLAVAGGDPWVEDGWRSIRVGAVLFDVVKPCARCVVTTVDQHSGAKNAEGEPLRTLQRFRRDARGQVIFGQNLIPRGTGVVRVGDPVEPLD